jgi:hypothetical protein
MIDCIYSPSAAPLSRSRWFGRLGAEPGLARIVVYFGATYQDGFFVKQSEN